MIKISYIIITWNGRQLLARLLESLKEQMQRSDVEVVVVDNGSTDGTEQFLKDQYPAIIYSRLTENKGVAFARNRAIELSSGKYLFVLDNDIIANDEALTGMESYMDEHADVGLSACRLVFADGNEQLSYKVYPGLTEKILNVLHPTRTNNSYASERATGEPFEPEYVIGACQVIRREVYQKVGPIDEHIFYGPEDCDYCLRVRQSGYKVIYLPNYTLIHFCQRKTTSQPFSKLGRKHIKALLYFYWKYKRLL